LGIDDVGCVEGERLRRKEEKMGKGKRGKGIVLVSLCQSLISLESI